MKIPFLNLAVKNTPQKNRLLNRFRNILDHGKILNGPEIDEFEKKISNFLKIKHIAGVSSGSSALYLALKSLNIGSGDEVITTPFTWIITINAILETGAKPVFVDIGEDLNIDPTKVTNAITKKTKAILPVHIGGHMCDMHSLNYLAKKNKLFLVEDAAQAIYSSLGSQKAGSFSSIAAFSLNPMKLLGAFGECGFVATKNPRLKKKVEILRHAGTTPDKKKIKINNCISHSLNHKIDTLQAACIVENLKELDKKWKKRDLIAKQYDAELNNIVQTQKYHEKEVHGRYLYFALCEKRDQLYNYLKRKKIECKIFYKPLACDAPIFKKIYKNRFKMTRNLLTKSLCLPLHENLSERNVEYIIQEVKKFYK